MRLVECITEAGYQGKQTTAIFLDVEKAFDRVWHEGVLYKLTEVLLPDCYVHLIGSFLRDCSFRVRIDPVSYTHLDVYKRQKNNHHGCPESVATI